MDRIRSAVASTIGDLNVIGGLGGFAGLLELPAMKNPVLVSAADGVGTKVLIAEALGIYDTVGIDLVAMSVNDLLVTGARPLFFLDYLAVGKLEPEKAASLVEGVAEGCRQSGCALLGGETAEMPGMYAPGEYDLAGFIVGFVEPDFRREEVRPGDLLVGLPASGLHTNGYSLARMVFEGVDLESVPEGLDRPLIDVLLEPHRSYLAEMRTFNWKAAAHVTGGGLTGNLPRALPAGLAAELDRGSWRVPPIFDVIQRRGEISDADMMATFNMGLGMVLVTEAALPGFPVVGQVVEQTSEARVRFR